MITTAARVRNLLWCALALSLLLHALAAPIFPTQPRVRPDDSPPFVSLDRPRPPKAVTTPPPIKPQVRPHTHPQRAFVPSRIAARLPIVSHNGVRPGPRFAPAVVSQPGNGSPADVTGPATVSNPVVTETPSCADPNRDAVASNVVSPEYPSSASGSGLGSVAVLVAVTIDASGNVSGARISQGSGNGAIDQAALRAARESSYKPRLVNCLPAAGDYIFRAEFTPDL